ncbi:MAG: hypothetical protein AAGA57_01885 [Planctomycetota bacterium]
MIPGVDFRPQAYVKRQRRRTRAVRMSAAAVLAAAAVAAGWVPLRAEVDQLTRAARDIETQRDELRQRADRVEALQAQAASFRQRAETQRKLAMPLDASRLLATLTGLAPSSIKLEQLELAAEVPTPAPADQENPGGAPAQPEPRYTLRIDGVAPDDRTIIDLVAAMSQHPMFQDVRAPSNQFTGYQGLLARRFSIEATAPLGKPLHFEPPAHTGARADAQPSQPGDDHAIR